MTTINAVNNGLAGQTGTGSFVGNTSPELVTPDIGTPSSGHLNNCSDLPISSGVSGLGSGVATFLATPSSANLANAVTDETGSGKLVFANAPTFQGATFAAANANPTSRAQVLSLTKYVSNSDVVVFNTTNETSLFNTGIGSLTYAANTTNVGMIIQIRIWISVNVYSAGGTLIVRSYIDSTVTNSFTLPAAVTGFGKFEIDLAPHGSSFTQNLAVLHFNGRSPVFDETELIDWDLTAAHTLNVTAQWSVASTNNNFSSRLAYVETVGQT